MTPTHTFILVLVVMIAVVAAAGASFWFMSRRGVQERRRLRAPAAGALQPKP